MKTVKDRIEEINKKGYPFSFDVTFDEATRIYKRVLLPAGLAFLTFGVLYFITVALLSPANLDPDQIKPNSSFSDLMREVKLKMDNLTLEQKITDGVVRIIAGVLMVPLLAGAVGLSRDVDAASDGSTGGIFQYFKGNAFSDLFVAGLLINLLTFGISLLGEYLLAFSSLFSFLLWLCNLCIWVFTLLFIPLIIFGNLGPIEAIRSSAVVVSKNFGTILLLMIVVSVLCALGFLGCCIGVFFTLPLYATFIYSLYKHSVGFEDNRRMGQFG